MAKINAVTGGSFYYSLKIEEAIDTYCWISHHFKTSQLKDKNIYSFSYTKCCFKIIDLIKNGDSKLKVVPAEVKRE